MSFSVASNDFIQVGIIVNTQGIKGELKIKPFTFDCDRFGMDVEYFVEGYENSFRIERYRINKNMVVIKFKEYDDIKKFFFFFFYFFFLFFFFMKKVG